MDGDGFDLVASCRGPSLILPGLYLGSIGATTQSELEAAGITHAVSVISGRVVAFPSTVTVKRVEADDAAGQDMLTVWDATHEFIASAISSGGVVLVHCLAGVSRSASVVIAYIMKELGITYAAARTHVTRARPIVQPNTGFEKQLTFYGNGLKCSLVGDSEAHKAYAECLIVETGALDTSLFYAKWTQLVKFCKTTRKQS